MYIRQYLCECESEVDPLALCVFFLPDVIRCTRAVAIGSEGLRASLFHTASILNPIQLHLDWK